MSAINWTARAREFLKTAAPPTDETDEKWVLAVSSVCAPVVFEEYASADVPGAQPYRLTPAEADAAHAEPWDDAAIGVFTQRVVLYLRRGINATDADDLAERLHLRDLQGDDRWLCLECRHLAGRRCLNAGAAGVARDLPAEMVMQLQHCPGFAET